MIEDTAITLARGRQVTAAPWPMLDESRILRLARANGLHLAQPKDYFEGLALLTSMPLTKETQPVKSDEEVLKQAHAALEREPRVNLHHFPIHLAVQDGALALEGEVENLAARKLALRLAEGVPGVTRVIDRIYVIPRERKGDGEMLDTLAHLLLRDCDLKNCTLRQRGGQLLHEAVGEDSSGEIEFSAADGILTLEGHVLSLSHRRIAEVLAWWVPGCRGVDNRLEVTPAEQDNDDEITDALRLVLEMDPLIRADQILVRTSLGVVSLDGVVAREEEKRSAELDAWYVPGVNEVVNRLEVR
jgi:osmotically-inducible protein OsmY